MAKRAQAQPGELTRDEINLLRRFISLSLNILENYTQEFEDKRALYDFVRAAFSQQKKALDELNEQVERINRLLVLDRTGHGNEAEAREIRSEINQELRSTQWQLQRHMSNLNYLSEQAASYGGRAPLDLINQIADEQEKVQELQQKLAKREG